ncbi:MAG: c-type cytochrome [Pseudomonadota bacterium]
MKSMVVLVAVLGFGLSGDAHAQDPDIAAGKAYAEDVCAQCHAVLANYDASPNLAATPFQQIAQAPGMTEIALSVWLQSSHPTMPNIILNQDEMRNVIGYIRSLDR